MPADQKAGPTGVELEEWKVLEQWLTSHAPAPWVVRTGVCKHDHPDTSADVNGAGGEFVADCGCSAQAADCAALIAAMRNALPRLLALARSALTAEAAGRDKWLEEALRAYEAAAHDPCDHVRNAIRALAQPSATRKGEE